MWDVIWDVLKKVLPGPMRRIEHQRLINILRTGTTRTGQTENTGPR